MPGFSSRILPCDCRVIALCLEYLVVRKSHSTSGLCLDYQDKVLCEIKTIISRGTGFVFYLLKGVQFHQGNVKLG